MNEIASISVTEKTTQRIVRSRQGSWRWQIPYRIHTYAARPGADGVLRWFLVGTSRKLAEAKLPSGLLWGGIHGRRVTSEVARDAIYSRD